MFESDNKTKTCPKCYAQRCRRGKSRNIFGFLFDLIFPKHCLGCEQIGEWLCPSCSSGLPEPALREVETVLCDSLDRLFYLADFDAPLPEKMVKTCKYQGVTELGVMMGGQLGRALATKLGLDGAVILPVPLHPVRLRTRGFNQAELIGRVVAKAIPGAELKQWVKRRINSRPQAKLDRLDRLTNLEQAFCLVEGMSSADCRFAIIVDDVVTTGTTINEVAKVLKAGGVKVVWGLAYAHGS